MSDTPDNTTEPTFDKRYWLFTYDEYDALGGIHDFTDSYDNLAEAMQPPDSILTIGHVFDSLTRQIVAQLISGEAEILPNGFAGDEKLSVWKVVHNEQ